MRINEIQIIEAVETLDEQPKVHQELITLLDNEYPTISYFVYHVDKDLLLEHELDEWFSLATIMLYAMIKGGVILPTEEDTSKIEEIEEQNWTRFEAEKGNFRDRLTVFFKDYPEEDLLAFVEDMLTEVEEDEISAVARDVIFIKSKTLIDYCIQT